MVNANKARAQVQISAPAIPTPPAAICERLLSREGVAWWIRDGRGKITRSYGLTAELQSTFGQRAKHYYPDGTKMVLIPGKDGQIWLVYSLPGGKAGMATRFI